MIRFDYEINDAVFVVVETSDNDRGWKLIDQDGADADIDLDDASIAQIERRMSHESDLLAIDAPY